MRAPSFALLFAATFALAGCASQPLTRSDDTPSPIAIGNSWADTQPRVVKAADTQPPATAPNHSAIDAAVKDVRDAETVDKLVDAYAAGLAVDSNSVALHIAYLRKVVDFDVPNLGVAAANRIVAIDPRDGLARAVLADNEARQGAMVAALTDLSIAAKKAPAEPFVQKTAGHLLAWYDNNPRPPQLPSNIRESLAAANKSLETSPAFSDAYREATDYFRQERQQSVRSPATQPVAGATTQPGPEASANDQPRPDFAGYTGSAIGYSPSPPTYYGSTYQPYGVYDDDYYGPSAFAYPGYYGWGPYWGSVGFFGVFGFDRFHDRFGHHHDFNRGFRDRFFGRGNNAVASGRGVIGTSPGNFSVGRAGSPDNSAGINGLSSFNSFGSTGAGFGRSGFSSGYYRSTPSYGSSSRFGSSRATPSFRFGNSFSRGGGFRSGGGFHIGGGGGGHR